MRVATGPGGHVLYFLSLAPVPVFIDPLVQAAVAFRPHGLSCRGLTKVQLVVQGNWAVITFSVVFGLIVLTGGCCRA